MKGNRHKALTAYWKVFAENHTGNWKLIIMHELFILPDGHKRCTGCGEIMLSLTDDHTLVFPDGFLEDIDDDRLPQDFDPDTLPDGMCPDCEVFSNE